LEPREREIIGRLQLLTGLPVLYVANVAEAALGASPAPALTALVELAAAEGAPVVVLSASFEAELAGLDPDDQELFLRDAGLDEPALHVLIRSGYRLLGLVTFFTICPPELRAWTVRQTTAALEAAGKIHTDFARGFIRAEVVSFDELEKAGGPAAAREQGLVRSEGRGYQVQDGDIIHFRFNVTT
ncbi:MAG: redox-regulated ATPase YchF, partial [Candidatus Desulforudis sp.]|nr:redox-regulated ATPase YchF [Desulforudis sp.]